MTRVGYWGYDNMEEFLSTINNTGLGAMEMLAMSLKVIDPLRHGPLHPL